MRNPASERAIIIADRILAMAANVLRPDESKTGRLVWLAANACVRVVRMSEGVYKVERQQHGAWRYVASVAEPTIAVEFGARLAKAYTTEGRAA